MGLATFTELKASIASWIKRDDLTDTIPDLITLAEARHARDLRLQPMLTTGTLATVASVSTVALPTGWVEFKSLTLAAQSLTLDPISTASFAERYASDAPGMPRNYLVQGANLVLGPKPDAVYSLTATYYARAAALSDVAPTNWLLTAHPGLYLWGALAEAEPFVMNDARATLWEGKYLAELAQARDADRNARGGSLRVRAR